MKKFLLNYAILFSMIGLTSCSQNFSNGERIGFLTKFSNAGVWWKSWEGELNLTQTGMNTSSTFQFSVDNDNPLPPEKIALLDSAANQGWKIKILYHQVRGWNWFSNRGHSDYFVKDVIVLDKKPMDNMFGQKNASNSNTGSPSVHDTIYVVIYRDKP